MEKKKKVLVVDDERAIREMLSKRLETMGYEVVSASNGIEGLRFMREEQGKFDLVITDRIMPGGPLGEEVVREIKRDYPAVKVIFMTGQSEAVIFETALRAGADKVFAKPLLLDTFEAAVKELLES